MPNQSLNSNYVKVNINMKSDLLDAYKKLGKMSGVPYSTLMRESLLRGIKEAAAEYIDRAEKEAKLLSEVQLVANASNT